MSDFYNDEPTEKLWTTEEKLGKLRAERNQLLNVVQFIFDRHRSEKEGIEFGGESKTTLTDEEYRSWLLWQKAMRDLPNVADLTNIDYDDIEMFNFNIFPAFPTPFKL